jgi:mannose-1-phosphate guanylyltransferase
MQALILVGGYATRLQPFTETRPKALIPILNKPMIMHIIDKVRGLVDDVILAVNIGKEQLEEYFNAHDPGMTVTLHPETEPLGTGGAIKNAEELINDTFIVFNGDVITSLDVKSFVDFHRNKGGLGALALWEVEDPTRFGIISIDSENRITRFLEKPKPEEIFSHLINAGTYCLEPEMLDHIPGGRKVSIEREVFPKVLDKGLYGLEFSGYWFDAGTPEIYLETNRQLLDRQVAKGELTDNISKSSVISPDAQIDQSVLIGDNCEIGAGTTLGPYVFLGDNVKLGEGCKISNSVIDTGTQISSSVEGEGLIIGRNNTVQQGLKLPNGLVTGDGFVLDSEFIKKL